MSVGIVARTPTHIVIAADTQKNYGATEDKRQATKIFSTPFGTGVLTGDGDAFEKIAHLLSLNPDPSRIVNWPNEFDWAALFVNQQGKLYDITAPGQISWPEEALYAVGSGERYAIGAAFGWLTAKRKQARDLNLNQLKTVCHIAVSAAINMDLHCGGEVELEYFEIIPSNL